MEMTIRRGVFETNSSSSHSITIETGGQWDTLKLNLKGNVHLYGGEFGWGWEKYNDAETKANYCAVYASNKDHKMAMLKKVIKDYTGARKVKCKFSTSWDHKRYQYSYIDHQSYDTCDEAFYSEENLKNFIFNKASWLFIGNDNGSPYPNFYDSTDTVYLYEIKFPKISAKLKSLEEKEIKNIILEHVLGYTDIFIDGSLNLEECSYIISCNTWNAAREIIKDRGEEITYESVRILSEELSDLPEYQETRYFTLNKL